jgi:hypothetical protein
MGRQGCGGLSACACAVYARGMGDPPKPQPASKPSNPVRQTGEDIAHASEEERRKQAARRGYERTLNPVRPAGSVLTTPVETKKTVLG